MCLQYDVLFDQVGFTVFHTVEDGMYLVACSGRMKESVRHQRIYRQAEDMMRQIIRENLPNVKAIRSTGSLTDSIKELANRSHPLFNILDTTVRSY